MNPPPFWCKHFKSHLLGWSMPVGNHSIVIVWKNKDSDWEYCPICGAKKPIIKE